MRFAWRIREKLLISSVILVVVVSILSYSSFHGASLFRGLTKSIRTRAGELPLAAKLSEKVSELRVTFLRFSLFNQLANRRVYGGIPSSVGPSLSGLVDDEISVRQEFLFDLEQVNLALIDYQAQLEENVKEGRMLSDVGREKMTVEELQSILSRIAADFARSDWVFTDTNRIALDQALMQLQEQVTLLPGFLTQRMDAFH